MLRQIVMLGTQWNPTKVANNARKSEYTYIIKVSYLMYTFALVDWYIVMFIDCSYLESVMHSLKSFPWSWLRSIHVREGKTYFHIWWLNFKQSLERRDFYIHAQCIYLKCVSMHKTIFMKSVFTLGYLYDACLLLLPNWAMPNSSKR